MNIRNFIKALACASLIFTVACDGDEETPVETVVETDAATTEETDAGTNNADAAVTDPADAGGTTGDAGAADTDAGVLAGD